MDKNGIRIVPYMDGKEKQCLCSGNLMKRYGVNIYNILLKGNVKILEDNVDETKGSEFSATLKLS